MKYKLAIFDLDGTVLDTLKDLANSLNHALANAGFPARSIDEVRSFVGNGIRKLVERGVPRGTPDSAVSDVLAGFTAHYKLHCADSTKPYDGVEDMLQTLRSSGCLTAVVSNKADFAVQALCERYFSGMFDAVAGEKPGVRRKPAPDTVNDVLERLNVDRLDAVYIGDSDVDIETARNAGMACISVDWGFRTSSELISAGATYLVSEPSDIVRLIQA